MNSTHPKPKICVVGACNIDLISYVPRMPAVGETLHGARFQMGFGGKGANQAVMAAKLGADVTMIAKLGRDVFGENTLKNFERFGIATRHVHFTDQAFSGVAPIAASLLSLFAACSTDAMARLRGIAPKLAALPFSRCAAEKCVLT